MIFKRFFLPVNLTNLEYIKLCQFSKKVGGLHILTTHLLHIGLRHFESDNFDFTKVGKSDFGQLKSSKGC